MKTRIFFIVAFSALVMSVGAATKRRVWNGPAKQPEPPKLEDLPMIPVDTLATKDADTKIIIYSNDTWRYYRPTLPARYDNLPVYTQHWDTDQIFAYRDVEVSDLPSVIELKLFSDIDGFHAPITGHIISPYGPRGRRNHNGVDVPLKVGDPIYATFDGKVRYSKYNTGGFGNLVIIRHLNGLETYYAHMTRANVESGDYVKAGQIIGFGGTTGRSYGPHLHFEVRYCDHTFDPQFIIDFENGLPRFQTFSLKNSYFNIKSRASDLLDEDINYEYNPSDTLLQAQSSDDGGTILERAEKQNIVAASVKAPVASQQKNVYYTVKSGDNLGKIAAKNGTTVAQLCKLNNITAKTTLKAGQKLRVK